jgi:uncharacterized secreted protein with C-terminal beta-propeller domain
VDDLTHLFDQAAAPRRLPLALRERIEAVLLTGDAPGAEPMLRGIDGPRALPPDLITRLEQTLFPAARNPEPSPAPIGNKLWKLDRLRKVLNPALAVAAAVLLLASTTVLVTRRDRSVAPVAIAPLQPSPSPSPSFESSPQPPPVPPPPPMPPGSLEAFPTAYQFLRYVRTEALKLIDAEGRVNNPFIMRSDVVPRAPTAAMARSGATTSSSGNGSGTGSEPQMQASEADSSAIQNHFSITNAQEAGVDEPDYVKNDGDRIVVVSGAKISLLRITRTGLELKSTIDVPDGGAGLFLSGNRLIHFSSTTKQAHPTQSPSPINPERAWVKVTIVDITRFFSPKVVASVEVEGSYVGARMAAGVIRLVVQSNSLGPPLNRPVDYSQEALNSTVEANKQAIKRSAVGHWLPHYVFERRGLRTQTGHVHDWNAISKPPDRSAGLSMTTVLTIDPADPKPNNAVSVIGSSDIIYASLNSLYVTSNRLDDVLQIQKGGFPKDPVTRIHKFDISDPHTARYVASGEVPGFLLNQFSLSENDGLLRAATTLGFVWMPPQQGTSESFVTVLAERDRQLTPIGGIRGIGKGERIYSVRFIGAMGYVVTFRQTDPLHVIDLNNPQHPELKGELKVPGYSGYLHPLSATLLLGVGRSADESGRVKGLQLSLFDVSDPANPKLLSQRAEGDYGGSSVEQDHHGFLYWEPKHLIVVPAVFASLSGGPAFYGALAMKVEPSSGFGDPVRLTHTGRPGADNYTQISRSIVIGPNLLTVSNAGILVSNLDSFAEKSWQPLTH